MLAQAGLSLLLVQAEGFFRAVYPTWPGRVVRPPPA